VPICLKFWGNKVERLRNLLHLENSDETLRGCNERLLIMGENFRLLKSMPRGFQVFEIISVPIYLKFWGNNVERLRNLPQVENSDETLCIRNGRLLIMGEKYLFLTSMPCLGLIFSPI